MHAAQPSAPAHTLGPATPARPVRRQARPGLVPLEEVAWFWLLAYGDSAAKHRLHRRLAKRWAHRHILSGKCGIHLERSPIPALTLLRDPVPAPVIAELNCRCWRVKRMAWTLDEELSPRDLISRILEAWSEAPGAAPAVNPMRSVPHVAPSSSRG